MFWLWHQSNVSDLDHYHFLRVSLLPSSYCIFHLFFWNSNHLPCVYPYVHIFAHSQLLYINVCQHLHSVDLFCVYCDSSLWATQQQEIVQLKHLSKNGVNLALQLAFIIPKTCLPLHNTTTLLWNQQQIVHFSIWWTNKNTAEDPLKACVCMFCWV